MMKKIIYSVLVSATIVSLLTQCKRSKNPINREVQQNLTVQDSIQIFSDSLFSKLKKNYLFKDKISWSTIKNRFEENALASSNFEESLKNSKGVFDSIECDHCMLFSENGFYPATQKNRFYTKITVTNLA